MTPQKDRKSFSNITNADLEQILEVNSKFIEVYIEVSNQFTEISKKLEDMSDKSCDHIIYCDKTIEKISENVSSTGKYSTDELKSLNNKIDNLEKKMAAFEQSMFKQNVAIITQLVIIIGLVIGKFLLKI
jgi:tetrahydromethanopterin S-methyltransferase subunit G